MKRFLFSIIVFVVILSLSSNVYAIGEITGVVRNTDIKAYVDDKPIKSFNVDNWTCIIAEDLRNYGFEVTWNPKLRTLEIVHSIFADTSPMYKFENNQKPIGSFAGYVYNTDIKTYVNGNPVTSFNIGGYTLIYIDDLMCYGNVIWNPEKREISYTRTNSWSVNLDNQPNKVQHNEPFNEPNGITHLSVEYILNNNGEYEINSENLDHISWVNLSYSKENGGMKLGFSLVSNHLFGDEEFSNLCSNISTVRYDDEILKDNSDLANQHAKVFINDVPIKITEVSQGKGNNHLDYFFHLDSNLTEKEIKSFKFKLEL